MSQLHPASPAPGAGRRFVDRSGLSVFLKGLALQFRLRPSLKRALRTDRGWHDFSVGFRTEDERVGGSLRFEGGRVTTGGQVPEDVDVVLVFKDSDALRAMVGASPTEILTLLLHNRLRTVGNFAVLNLFNHLLCKALGPLQRGFERRRREGERAARQAMAASGPRAKRQVRVERLAAEPVDPGVRFLTDPYLSTWSLTDFPRLGPFLERHFCGRPEVCPERLQILTRWFREHGFEVQADGSAWRPELRQAHALRHLLATRRPIIRAGDLLAGTTTSKDTGVLLFGDGIATTLWGELDTLPDRELNPYDVSGETRDILHREVLPYWVHRNFREVVREAHGNPLCQQLDERFAVYFVWKTVGISHTIADLPKVLRLGTEGIRAEVAAAAAETRDQLARQNLEAMTLMLEGVEAYAAGLSEEARREAAVAADPTRRAELEHIAEVCARVPRRPATTLDEAVQSVWTIWVALHQENSNTGLSIGRLDQWLQPYLEADLEGVDDPAAREAIIAHAIELLGCLFLRCTDHLPTVPDLGNYLFGGSSSDQVITLGGVTPDGADGVNDMTYILLKVTELLGLRDPNVNARFHPGINSDTYLRRLCEVNLITTATPSMHNDLAVARSLAPHGYSADEINDWSATGCVEPTICGKHMGHTGSILLSLVAPLEMALDRGRHPLMDWRVGPDTGERFESFEAFFEAYTTQLDFLLEQSTTYNALLGEAHRQLRPTPLLSSLIDGCVEAGRDVTHGGARHNSSGVALIGLADVTDSLMAIKTLVFDEGRVDFDELAQATATGFVDHPALHAMVRKRVGLFGSGSADALALANRVAAFAHGALAGRTNPRGGPYTAGFWSMSNHVAFGTLAGALPSGRAAGKAFTPGLTPQPIASRSLLDNLRDVAGLDPTSLDNNIAFNVRVVPSSSDSHAEVVDTMTAYAASYFELGGMQMQMNVVDSAVLRDAMANPDEYRNLLVRISGYNAYFVTLNRDMQIELIERAEYGL